MNLFIIVMLVHFAAGAAGILIINRSQNAVQKRATRIKYLWYLIIFAIVVSAIISGKYTLTAIVMVIFSGSVFELLRLKNLTEDERVVSSFTFSLLFSGIFTVTALLFILFIFLPSNVILFTYSIIIVFDGASQIAGQIAGRTKILPEISPGKTYEGLSGGIISALITSAILHDLLSLSVLYSLVAGLVISLTSFTGDLLASLIKRRFGVKDFGNILPGQGGILDRFDSFIFTGAIAGLINLIYGTFLFEFNINLLYYLGYSSILLIILLTGELIYSFSFLRKAEWSRMFTHIASGLICLFLIRVFDDPWFVAALCVQSSLFLFATRRMRLFSSHHGVVRETNGSILFFAGILITYCISIIKGNVYLYYLPLAILAISDPLASLVGMNINKGFWPVLSEKGKSSKTIYGSLAFFISASVILLLGLPKIIDASGLKLAVCSFIIASLSAIIEAYSNKGSDNLFVPVFAALSLLLISW